MKFLLGQFLLILTGKKERNLRMLGKFFLILITMVTVFSVLFHFLMILEDKKFSWITGFYWTLTVMSTLGFGDITFDSDLGKLFSIAVLLSGIVLLLIMLPFTFIQFFYAPWLEAQTKARAPRELPEDMEGHVILTNYDPVTMNLIDRLRQYQYEYVIVTEDIHKALELFDLDYKVVLGELGDPETYRRLKVHKAALVVANIDDMMNTNIAFTVREISKEVPIAANANLDVGPQPPAVNGQVDICGVIVGGDDNRWSLLDPCPCQCVDVRSASIDIPVIFDEPLIFFNDSIINIPLFERLCSSAANPAASQDKDRRLRFLITPEMFIVFLELFR